MCLSHPHIFFLSCQKSGLVFRTQEVNVIGTHHFYQLLFASQTSWFGKLINNYNHFSCLSDKIFVFPICCCSILQLCVCVCIHSLPPYGSEHACKLLSVSDSLPPTPIAESDVGLRRASCKTAADGKDSGTQSHCDGQPPRLGLPDSCFSACARLSCKRAVTPAT